MTSETALHMETEHPAMSSPGRAAVEAALEAALPYVSPVLLQALASGSGRQPTWIEPVNGSLLLADVSGFTTISERLAAYGRVGSELLTSIINQYFERMLDIAREHGGGNLKFGGDAILLLFQGAQHASRAVAAALAMQTATRQFSRVRVGPERLRLRMSIGVHSGWFWSAAAGQPGSRMQHFILGHDVAEVAAIQGTATAGEVFVSRAVARQAPTLETGEQRSDALKAVRLRGRREALRRPLQAPSGPPPTESVVPFLPPAARADVLAGKDPRRLEGEHRNVIVVFISVHGVNEALEEAGPEALLARLQAYSAAVDELAATHGGYVVSNDVDSKGIKYIVTFGAPAAHEDDAANALRFALALKARKEDMGLDFRHRIGVNGGLVFAGEVGASFRREYTVMGDAVNLAARLMAAASYGEVLVSAGVATEAGPSFELRELAPMSVKGKSRPVAVSALLAERREEAVRRELAPLVGREAETRRFTALCREVERGNGRLIAISGQPGTGKSRLTLALQEQAESRGWRVLAAQCHFHTSGSPFAPWVEILGALLGLDAAGSSEERTAKVAAVLQRLGPEMVDRGSLLNQLLRVSLPGSGFVESLPEDERRRRLFDLVLEVLRASAAESGPVIATIKNLQWADASTLRLVEHVAAGMKASRLALVVTYRPEEGREPIDPALASHALALEELTPEDAAALVRQHLGPDQAPDHVVQAVLARSGGNPLLIEEAVRALRETGALEKLLAGQAAPAAEGTVSDRVQALLMSRLDSLPAATKEVFRAAAVVGNPFEAGDVEALLAPDLPGLRAAEEVRRLERTDFLVALGAGAFRFRHTVAQEVAYESLSFAQRRRLHGRAAARIETIRAGEVDALAPVLFHHYDRAADAPKTVVYAAKAGDRARDVYASGEALGYYRRGIDVLDGMDHAHHFERSYLLERVGDGWDGIGRYREAAESYVHARREWRRGAGLPSRTLIEPASRVAPRARETLLCRKAAVAYERSSDYDGSLRWLEAAQDALPPRASHLAASVSVARCVSLFRKGLYEEAIAAGSRGLELARRGRDPAQLAHAHNMLANPLQHLGQLKAAARHLRRAVNLYEQTGDLPGQARASSNLGACYAELGLLDDAYRHYEHALTTYGRIGNPLRGAIADNNIGELLLLQARLDEAAERFARVIDVYERAAQGRAALSGYASVNLSRAYLRGGRLKEARDALDRGLRVLRAAGARALEAEARLQQAELDLAEGRLKPALRVCRRALNDLQARGAQVLVARGLRLLGRVTLSLGDADAAEHHLRESVAIAESLGADKETAPSLLYLGRLYAAGDSGKQSRAAAPLARAAAIFRRLGAEADAQSAERLLVSATAPAVGPRAGT